MYCIVIQDTEKFVNLVSNWHSTESPTARLLWHEVQIRYKKNQLH